MVALIKSAIKSAPFREKPEASNEPESERGEKKRHKNRAPRKHKCPGILDRPSRTKAGLQRREGLHSGLPLNGMDGPDESPLSKTEASQREINQRLKRKNCQKEKGKQAIRKKREKRPSGTKKGVNPCIQDRLSKTEEWGGLHSGLTLNGLIGPDQRAS
jgi:hypothetical protein